MCSATVCLFFFSLQFLIVTFFQWAGQQQPSRSHHYSLSLSLQGRPAIKPRQQRRYYTHRERSVGVEEEGCYLMDVIFLQKGRGSLMTRQHRYKTDDGKKKKTCLLGAAPTSEIKKKKRRFRCHAPPVRFLPFLLTGEDDEWSHYRHQRDLSDSASPPEAQQQRIILTWPLTDARTKEGDPLIV